MFDWKEYLDFAHELVKPAINMQGNEACLRSAVSRAYYASFHKARMFTYAHGYTRPKRSGDEHSQIPEFLKKQMNLQLQKAGQDLSRLKRNRAKCDYENQISNISNFAKLSLMIANRVYTNIP